MSEPHHRMPAGVAPSAGVAPHLPGNAPGGLWAATWRLHRNQVLILLATAAALAIGIIALRMWALSLYQDFGCNPFGVATEAGGRDFSCSDAQGVDLWWGYGIYSKYTWLQLLTLVAPIVFGAYSAAPVFTREFSRGTHVFALTQSVTRRQWMTAKLVVLAVPLTVALLVLGYLREWFDHSFGNTVGQALQEPQFFSRGPIPAAVGLMVFGLTIAIGMVTRNLLSALIVGALLGGTVFVGATYAQPHLLPAERATVPISALYPQLTPQQWEAQQNGQWQDPYSVDLSDDPDARWLDHGYLDAAEKKVPASNFPAASETYYSSDLAFNHCYLPAGEAAANAVGLPWDGYGGVRANTQAEIDKANSLEYQNAYSAAFLSCLTDADVAYEYRTYQRGSILWPLRGVTGGLLLLLSAAFIAVGGWRLRAAVAKR